MGQDKALLPWDGQTFLSATIERLKPYSQMVIVVGGANAEKIKPTIYSRGAYLVVNRQPERGQFSSLRLGLQEVLNRGRDAAIVALVDRPPASTATIEKLIDVFKSQSEVAEAQAKWAIVPEHSGKHGHPIVISREMIECLLKADAASNAREVEHANQQRIQYLPVDDANVVANLNTPEEYAQLTQHAAKS
jgi:molybdenum cofactor cytidylyltransferase